MLDYIGLSIDEAQKHAEAIGLETVIEHYETKRSLDFQDREIVVRSKQDKSLIVFTVCGFKTKV